MSISSFASWFRGASISNSAGASTGRFEHAYRGWLGAPVVRVGSAHSATPAGGLSAGGTASAARSSSVEATSGLALGGTSPAFAVHLVLAGVGLSAGGSSPSSLASLVPTAGGLALGGSAGPPPPAYETSGSFRYWRGGASISSSASGSTGRFEHAYRGSIGFSVVSPAAFRSYSESASGGVGMGGATASVLSVHPATASGVAVGFGGSPQSAVSWSVVASGGLSIGGGSVSGVSKTVVASGGLGLGGRREPSLAAAPATGGGLSIGGFGSLIELGYHIYVNDGQGGPIDYAAAVATVYDLTWTSPVLAAPGSYKFGVRAFGPSGLEEQNLDASARLDLDASGGDVTWVPLAPLGVRALPLAGGRVRVEWIAPPADRRRRPTGFRVYAQPGALTDYTTPAALAPNTSEISGAYAVEIGPLVGGVGYAVGVRAYNLAGEESNANSVRVDADALPPSPIESLQATPLSSTG